MLNTVKRLKNKELFIALYFLLFILGMTVGITSKFYNEFRVLQLVLLFSLGLYSLINKRQNTSKTELLFLLYICVGSFFWQNYQFIVVDLLLAYLLYKSFFLLEYNEFVSKIIVFASLLIFPLLPLSIADYINTGIYYPIWHPMPWNIRVFDSYLLITSIFAVWFYNSENKYKNVYLLFFFLSFFSTLINAGRSATLAYTVFITVVVIFNRATRWPLLSAYLAAWLAYISVTYLAAFNFANSSSTLEIQIARTTTSLRYDLWLHAFECWHQSPIVGCGFYQLGNYEYLAAHPHNLLIQVLTETGLIGLGFLLIIIFVIFKKVCWGTKESYFTIAALLSIAIDLSLSGSHIYPITQMALLWLLVFLLKNPVFQHASYFNKASKVSSSSNRLVTSIIYFILMAIFIYILITTSLLSDSNMLTTPPRFWEYGYQLL